MPVTDKENEIRQAFRAANDIYHTADRMLSYASSIKFDKLRDDLDILRRFFQASLQPVLDNNTAADFNTAVTDTGFVGAPAQAYEAVNTLRSALIALYQRYDSQVFPTLTPVTHSVAGGHESADISLSQLQSLGSQVQSVRSAADQIRIP